MLKKEVIQKIATLLKLDPVQFESAIVDKNEIEVPIASTLTVLTEVDMTTLRSNEYNRGKSAGVEMEIKEVKKRLGFEFAGKNIDALVSAVKTEALKEASLNPIGKTQELENKITTLQNTVLDYEGRLALAKLSAEVSEVVPKSDFGNPILTTDEIIQLMKINGYEFKAEGGATVTYKAGQRIADQLSTPVPVKSVVQAFISEKNLSPEPFIPGGRGGGDKNPPGKAGKLSELKKQFTDQGKSLLGTEFSQAVAQAAKDNSEFDMKA